MIHDPVRFRPLLLLALIGACSTHDTASRVDGVEQTVLAGGDTTYNEPSYSPDGRRIAYRAEAHAREAVYVANADGSHPTMLSPASQYIRLPLWSPDGTNIGFTSDLICPPDVYVVPAAGGEARRMTKDRGLEYLADWRPGTNELLIRSNKGGGNDLYGIALTGERQVQVTSFPGNEDGRWSPDGTRLAFTRTAAGKSTVWLTRPGTDAKPLTTEGYEVFQNWSPDGSIIAYTSSRTGRTDIWVMPVDSGEGRARQLTNDLRADDAPQFSPDGKWIAYNSWRGGQPDLWIVPVAGGESIRVTDDVALEGVPAWSRDGNSITYSTDDTRSHLWVIAAEGGTPRQLTTGTGNDHSHVISPDGAHVAFVSDRAGSNDIFVVPIAGGEPVQLTSGSTDENAPQWSADGSRILFISRRGPTTSVFVIPARADSGTTPDATKLLDWSESQLAAKWSPDGTLIAFTTSRGSANTDVWVVGADGRNPRRLTTNATALNPFWSPDGASIVYTMQGGGGAAGEYSAHVVSGTGGRSTRIPFDGYMYAFAWSPAGILLGGSQQCTSKTGIDSYLVRAPGEKPVRIFADTLHDTPQGSSPDGSVIGVVSRAAGNSDIVLIPVAGGPHRRLTTSPATDVRPIWTPDGKLVVYVSTPVGNRLVTARVSPRLQASPER